MAYEDLTYDVILGRLLDQVAIDYPNLDTREGSILYNALAPAALELAIAYTELENTRNESFVNTATREYILTGCQDMGIDIGQFDASAGIHKGEFNVEISIGSRWNCDLYNYEAIELIGKNTSTGYYEYQMRCETVGTNPNNQKGALTAITEIPNGLNHAMLTECLIEGENETSDDDIRVAYYNYLNDGSTDGNVAQYKEWCNEFDGIGNSKIFPLWNGANTVKVSILSASNKAATPELIAEFQEYLDPNSNGMGDGVAPIGAVVTVSTATELPINISANVTFKEGYSDTTPIKTAINEYLSSIAYEKTQVPYMNVGAIILGVEGVSALNNLLINGGTTDVALGDEQIPIEGTINLTVVK